MRTKNNKREGLLLSKNTQKKTPARGISILAFFLIFSFTITAQIPNVGLIGSWPFTGNALDATAANHGTVTNATLTFDRCGNANSAYSFNGTSSYILMNACGPTGTLSRSVSFWARTTNTVINSPRVSFDYGLNSGNNDTYQIEWNYCGPGVGLDLSNQALIRGNNCLLNGGWHHIVSVFNATASLSYSNVIFYIDGVAQPVISCNVSGINASINTGTVYPITIGRGCTPVRYWIGDLDDFYLYNRALSQQEVLQLYNAIPCTPPIFGSTLVCPGTAYTYSVNPFTNATYTWTLPNGWTGSSSTNTISVISNTNGGIISVAASSPSCGIFPTSTLAVSTMSFPIMSVVASNSTTCIGGSATLTASGASSYSWNTGPNTATIVVSPNVTTNYTVSGTGPNGCKNTIVHTQSVVSNPTLTVGSGLIGCNGNSIAITASGANSYTWLPGPLTGSAVNVAPLVTTVYTITGLTPFGCTASAQSTITVAPALTVVVTANSPTACAGGSITFTATNSGGTPLYSYSWSGGPPTNTYNVSMIPGTYVFTVTGSDINTCSKTKTISATFLNTVTFPSPSMAICPGATGTLNATGGVSYTWLPSGQTGNTFTANPFVATGYTFVGMAASGCTATGTGSILIKPAPALTFNTFSITCGSLGSATVNASGGTGPFSYTWTPSAQTGSAASGLIPGTYTITVLDNGTGCAYTPTTNFIPLVPLTGTVTATGSMVCYGYNTGSANISLSGGSGNQSYQWSSPTGTQSIATATLLGGGVHTVNVVDALTFCSVTKTFVISQPPALTLTIPASSSTVCLGGSITFTASTSGGTSPYTYTWSAGPQTQTQVVNETIAALYIYSVSSTDANNCLVTKTISAGFVNNPTVTVLSMSVCQLFTASLVASGASTYSWNTGVTSATLSGSPPATTIYTVVGTALACSNAATGTITILPAPVPNITSNAPICHGDSLKLSASGGINYLWTGPQGFLSASATTVIVNATPIRTGLYFLKVTGANTCTNIISQWLTVNPLPVWSAFGSTVCEGQALSLLSGPVTGGSYFWAGPNSFTSTLQNPLITPASTLMTGIYTITVASAAGCTVAGNISASVVAKPQPTINSNSPVCYGSTLTLGTNGGTSYLWSGPSNFYSNSQTATINSIISGGTYSVVVGLGPCAVTATATVLVNPLPVPAISNNNSPVCELKNITLNGAGGISYLWTGPAAFASTLTNVTIGPASFTHSGTYTLVVTDVNSCVNTTVTTVKVIPNPVPGYTAISVCLGNPAAVIVDGGNTYSWTGPGGFTSTASSFSISITSTINTGNYTVVVTGTNNCSVSLEVPVTANPFALPAVQINAPPKSCLNSLVSLQGSGGDTYLWNGPNNYTSTGQTATFMPTGLNMAGIYTLTVKNSSNCVASKTLNLILYKLPGGNLYASKNNLCAPFCSEFKLAPANNTAPIVAIDYQVNKKLYTDSSLKFCFGSPGLFQVSASFRDTNNCVNVATLTIEAFPKPNADFDFQPEKPLADIDQVHFYYSASGAGINNFTWFLTGNNKDTVKEKDPTFLFKDAGIYPVVLVVSNKWGCADTMVKNITVADEFVLYVPNVFTPNGDGLNDIFQPKGQGFLKYKLEIFDRWGQLIFHTNNFNVGWDGKFRGQDCKHDSYSWKIELTNQAGKARTFTGHVMIIKGTQPEE